MADSEMRSELGDESPGGDSPQQSPEQPEPAPSCSGGGLGKPARGFVRFLYSSNPFYVISADLVFVGLKASFGSRGPASESWALLFGLAGYTLLLAATACYLIRAGKLWDDLRSLLILIVILFMTMAMSGDDTLAANPAKGMVGCVGGLIFAVIVTEAILATIRLRLPGWYRVAYYLILSLMFLYPIILIPLAAEPDSPQLQWALFCFPAVAGVVLTALIPAARGGAAYVAVNVSPWRWPLFPWSLFLIMAGGLAVRSYSLCVSFHFVGGTRTIFAPYFLVPIGLAVSLVWLEIAIVSGRRGVMFTASLVPLALVFEALSGHRYEPVYERFLAMFMNTLGGSPGFIALIAAAIFYAYAAVRKVPAARELFCVSLIGLAMVGPRTIMTHEITRLRPEPLIAAGLVLGLIIRRRRAPIRALAAACLVVYGITGACEEIEPAAPLASIAVHLGIVALMILGARYDGWLRDLADVTCPIALLVLGLTAVLRLPPYLHLVPAAGQPWYPCALISFALTYGLFLHRALFTASAIVILSSWMLHSGIQMYQQLRRLITGLDQLGAGMLLFIVALLISLRKAGLLRPIEVGAAARRLHADWRAVSPQPCWDADELQAGAPASFDSPPNDDPGAAVTQSDP